MDIEVVVKHIHNGILFSHKKECIWVSSDEVDEPRTYYTEQNESERDKYHILWYLYENLEIYAYLYENLAYIWNLEKWYWRIYLQGSNGETDIENRLIDMGRGEKRVRCMERVTWKLTLPYVK